MSKKYNIGFTCSCFDLLHAGHITMLQEAKSICNYLIVGLQVDPTLDRKEKNKPIQSLLERQIQLSAVKFIDQTIIYHTENDLLDILSSLPIDVRIVGEEYKNKQFTGCRMPKIDIYYNKRKHPWSSSGLRDRLVNTEKR